MIAPVENKSVPLDAQKPPDIEQTVELIYLCLVEMLAYDANAQGLLSINEILARKFTEPLKKLADILAVAEKEHRKNIATYRHDFSIFYVFLKNALGVTCQSSCSENRLSFDRISDDDISLNQIEPEPLTLRPAEEISKNVQARVLTVIRAQKEEKEQEQFFKDLAGTCHRVKQWVDEEQWNTKGLGFFSRKTPRTINELRVLLQVLPKGTDGSFDYVERNDLVALCRQVYQLTTNRGLSRRVFRDDSVHQLYQTISGQFEQVSCYAHEQFRPF